jgi:hypothetical protein
MAMACPTASARPPVVDHEKEVGSAAGANSGCERTPCPHCILGIDHAANLAEAMLKWQEIVWDYSSTMTVPDAGYFIKLMAIQWIGTLEVTPFPPKQKSMCARRSVSPGSCGLGSFSKTFQMPGASAPRVRCATQKSKRTTSFVGVHGPGTSKQCPNKMPQSATKLEITAEDTKRRLEERHECGAGSEGAACGLHHRPPGLDSPRHCTAQSVWQVQHDPRTDTWRPMNDVLCNHLEECWKRGLSATAVEQNGKHHYYDLRQMYRYNAKTGIGCRIRRMVVER